MVKNPVNYYLNEIDHYDDIQSCNSQFIVTQVTARKNKILNNNDKYNNVKPTLDLLTARIIQSGTNEFNEHLNFLNVIVDLISLNKDKESYNYANSLKHIYSKQQDQKIEQEPFINLPNNIQQEPAAKQAKLDQLEEEIEEQNVMKFNQEQELEQEHDVKSFQEGNEQLPKLELESEPKEEQAHIVNAPKANAFYIGVHCDSHIIVILHLQTFIFIPRERAQNFASFGIKK